jgi:dipeptidyl aminopeptidase/acylaminoacyl peptidase
MIDNEDMPTIPRPIAASDNDNAPPAQVAPDNDEDTTTVQAPTEDEDAASAQVAAENEDTASAPTASSEEDNAATIQVPVAHDEATATPAQQSAAPAPSLPYMSIDDLLALRIASDPQISPDGTLIAFTVQRCHADTNTTSSSIWLVSSAGGKHAPPWQVTGGQHHDSAPRWSPDGRMLAFLSDRSGTTQIYLLPMYGGEARELSMLRHGVTEYSWRPDGRALLAHSAWKPEDDQGADRADDDTALVYTRLGEQWDGEGYRQRRHQQLWFLPLEDAALRLTSEPVDLMQSCWSPDGTEIAFCANRRPDPDLSVSVALWVLTLATGQMRRLTPEEGTAQMPSWSPDGQFIAYLYTPDQTEAGNIVPWIVEAHGAATPRPAVQGAEVLTCQAWVIDELRSEWLMRPQWYPDGKALLVAAQERGQVHLYRLDRAWDTMVRLTAGNGRYVSPQISKDGQTIVVVRADWFTPGDIWCMNSQGQQLRKLSGVNDTFLRSRQLIRPRRITWQSFDGLEIEGWLYLPPLPEQARAPLIVVPHGGPSLAWGDGYVHEFQVLAGRGYAVLAPNPRGSAGYGEEFTRKVLNDWGGDDFRDLMAGVDHVIASEPVDGTRLGISGISYGGYMTNRAITQTNRFKAAVSRNGISSIPAAGLLSDQTLWFNLSMDEALLQQNRSALTFADRITTPLLLLHAEDDLRCPFSESLQLFVHLRKRKHPVELVRYRHVSHLMDWPDVGTPRQRVDRLRRTVGWFAHFL